MEEVENQGVVQQEIEAQKEIAIPETEASQDQSQLVSNAQAKQNHAWATMRRKNEELERKALMQEELIKQLITQQQKNSVSQSSQEEDIIAQLASQEYVPGEAVAKAFKAHEQKIARQLQEVESRYQGVQNKSIYDEVKREHADFDEVVNPDTLALLKELDPRRASALENTSDPYVRWATTYDIIKARGLASQIHSAKQSKEVDKKIEQNKKVVQSPQVYDKRPMAKAFDYARMDQKLKEELQSEMNHYAGMAHGVPHIGT